MGYNGSNRKGYDVKYRGFSKSANNTAERILFGPKSFRNAVAKIVIAAGSTKSSARPKKLTSTRISASDKEAIEPQGTYVEQKLYKCECGKISYLETLHTYCPSCGRWLSEKNSITSDDAAASMKSGCLGVLFLPLLIVGILFLIIL